MQKYVLVLSPPYCGSTLLWQLLQTSPHVSALPSEGTRVPSVKDVMSVGKWNPEHALPWPMIKAEWSKIWDMSKPILLEKSPPNMIRAKEIERTFVPSSFIVLMRDPYALCEGMARRRNRRHRLFRDFHDVAPRGGNARGDAMRFAATLWIRFATQQIKNAQELERVICLNYEELTGNPEGAAEKILSFLPELGQLDVKQKFRVHSVTGTDSRVLTDMNDTKWKCLRRHDIAIINDVLRNHGDLLEFFGCRMRQPDRLQDLRAAVVSSTSFVLKLNNEGQDAIANRTAPTGAARKWRWLPRASAG
jgi:hypothetical protein